MGRAGFLQQGDRQPPAEGAALIGVIARSHRAIQARCGAGDSDAVMPQGCQKCFVPGETITIAAFKGFFPPP